MAKKPTSISSSTTPTLRREEKKLRTRTEVLKAALAEFRERGFAAASTSEIARRAGVSHGAVFTVAPTKEKLAAAAFEGEVRCVGELAFARAFTSSGNVVARVAGIFAALYDFYEQNHQIARVLLSEMMLCAPTMGEKADDRLLNDYVAGLRMLLQTAVERKQIAPITDMEALTSALVGIYLVFLLARLNDTYPDRATHSVKCRRAIGWVLEPIEKVKS